MIDFQKKIKNSNKFRKPALTFVEVGSYCSYPKGTVEYMEFWERERKYCIDGYTAEDGDYITGYHYFYLNYCPITRMIYEDRVAKNGKITKAKRRDQAFPDFYDYDYYYFQAIQEAENSSKHMCVAKSRRKGFSYKGGSMMCRNFFLIPNSKSYVYAANKQYLTDDGILTKAWDFMDFIDENTAWGKKRQAANTAMRRRASFFTLDEFGNRIEAGYKSEIIGVSLKDNPDVVRGKAAKLILFEEAGSLPELPAAWQVARPSVEHDGVAFGLMLMFGCVCKGTRVWTADGNCVNIEDIKQQDGILGWNTYGVDAQSISNINPPSKKECLRIHLRSGRILECSKDHPLMWSTPGRTSRVKGKRATNEYMKKWLWHEAEKCKIGEQVGIIEEIPAFGTKKAWEPRLVGLLVGDGSYGFDKTPVIATCDSEVQSLVFSRFNYAVEKSYETKSGKTYMAIRIKGITKQLRELGIYGQTKTAKRLPNDIHTWDKESIAEFLAGLYDADGYIRFTQKQCAITLTQCQKEILLQVQELLLHFGIHGSIRYIKPSNRSRKIKDINGEWRLDIRDVISLSRFAEHIPLQIEYKAAALDCIALFTENRKNKHNQYLVGVRADKIVAIEDIGLQDIYNLTAKEYSNYIANGIVTHNTGGDDGRAIAGLKTAFYDPDSYNCLGFENIWDDGLTDKKCGFFVPQHTNLDTRDADGNRLYMDEDGNTLHNKAREYVLSLREEELRNATDSASIDRYIAERSESPMEAFMELSGNIFPKKDLQQHLAKIRTNRKLQNRKQVGDLVYTEGRLSWVPKKTGDITRYTTSKKRDEDMRGSIVIWEHPMPDSPFGMYIAGCLTPGEKVLTDSGLMNVEDVGLTDRLINKDGEFVEIANLQRYQKVNEDVYRIRTSNNYRSTNFTGEHPIYIKNKKTNEFSFVKARNIKVGDWIKYPNIYLSKNNWSGAQFNFENNTDFWWFVGLWLGDGWCEKTGYKIGMSFNYSEKEYIVKYKEIVKKLFNRAVTERLRGNCLECTFGYKDLHSYLINHFNNGAENKNIPEWVKYINNAQKENLILGYLASDGCVTKNKSGFYNIEFVSISLELLEGIQDILFSLGYISSLNLLRKARFSTIKGRPVKQKETYHLRISNNSSIKLKIANNHLDNTKLCKITLDRKNRNTPKRDCYMEDDLSYIYFQIKEIEQDFYTGLVYNFECATHTFLTRGITTHNCDPYDHDQAGTNSLGSIFIYKRFQSLEAYHDILVAEYTGRPDTAEDFYENARKLLLYYNARLMYENQNKGLFAYFTNKHCDYLLADQPDIINSIISSRTTVTRRKGCHMTKEIKLWGEGLIKEWLIEEIAPGVPRLTTILSEPLLEELISYNNKGNFDRVMALIQVMIYREQLYNLQIKDKEKEEKRMGLFDKPIFSDTWFSGDDTPNDTQTQIYMF